MSCKVYYYFDAIFFDFFFSFTTIKKNKPLLSVCAHNQISICISINHHINKNRKENYFFSSSFTFFFFKLYPSSLCLLATPSHNVCLIK